METGPGRVAEGNRGGRLLEGVNGPKERRIASMAPPFKPSACANRGFAALTYTNVRHPSVTVASRGSFEDRSDRLVWERDELLDPPPDRGGDLLGGVGDAHAFLRDAQIGALNDSGPEAGRGVGLPPDAHDEHPGLALSFALSHDGPWYGHPLPLPSLRVDQLGEAVG